MKKFLGICTLMMVMSCLVINFSVHAGKGSIKPLNEPDYPKKSHSLKI